MIVAENVFREMAFNQSLRIEQNRKFDAITLTTAAEIQSSASSTTQRVTYLSTSGCISFVHSTEHQL